MPSKQVREILDQIRDMHRNMSARLREINAQTDDPRLQFMTNYMADHENRIDRCIAGYELDAAGMVLNTWLQFGSEDEISRHIDDAPFDSAMSVEDIANAALEIEQQLVALYRELSDATSVPELKELFDSLITLEQNKGRHYARAISEMMTG